MPCLYVGCRVKNFSCRITPINHRSFAVWFVQVFRLFFLFGGDPQQKHFSRNKNYAEVYKFHAKDFAFINKIKIEFYERKKL